MKIEKIDVYDYNHKYCGFECFYLHGPFENNHGYVADCLLFGEYLNTVKDPKYDSTFTKIRCNKCLDKFGESYEKGKRNIN